VKRAAWHGMKKKKRNYYEDEATESVEQEEKGRE